jgi:hypothetical protein
MGKWKGIMQTGLLEIPINVIYNPSSVGVSEWYGSGITDKYWLMNQPHFETNIGTVLIVKDAIRLDGKHYIEFKGSRHPKGPLAEGMN